MNEFNEKTPLFLDPSKKLEERIEDLVYRLTLEEKISQLLNDAPEIERLGIPKYNWWNECLHGVAFAGVATVFPQAIGLAATFDLELVRKVAKAISDEARAKHHEAVRLGQRKIFQGLTCWSPNINIFRDPRWGRGQETFGEDPYLTSRMGVEYVKGLQGNDDKYLKVVATPKHFAAYSGLESERHFFDAKVSMKDLWETYLPAFRACIIEGKAEGIMGAYNRLNGEPCCASPYLLNEVLRKKWNFQGHVVSDCGAIMDIYMKHEVVSSGEEAAALAIKAGCDLFCCINIRTRKKKKIRWDWINGALQKGLLSEKDINKAVKRLFRARFLLGMFDPPELVKYSQIPYEVNDCNGHRALALEAAKKSIVLLKNEEKILPLDRNLKKIAVIGPNADNLDVLLGNYNGTPSKYTTILEGIKKIVSPRTEVLYSEGSPLKRSSKDGFEEAISIARQSDVVIMVLGLSPRLEGEEGEAVESDLKGDRLNLNLPGSQEPLLKEIDSLGVPIILILTGGSALAVDYAKESVPAILESWYPGEEGGQAVAEVLFGLCNPAGRLPITFYKSTDQLPDFRDYSMQGRTYRYFEGEPLFPFGLGLSYTKFEYDNLIVDSKKVEIGEDIKLNFVVRNVGNIAGDEVIQLYLKHLNPSCRAPRIELKGFKRIFLNPNDEKKISFTLSRQDYCIVNDDGRRFVEPDTILITIGGTQPDTFDKAKSHISTEIELFGTLIFLD
ncbi:MAG: glycoside hydrolase family 3 C-terminal domain-containing protein [Promethearchaeota archaeon]